MYEKNFHFMLSVRLRSEQPMDEVEAKIVGDDIRYKLDTDEWPDYEFLVKRCEELDLKPLQAAYESAASLGARVLTTLET